MEEMLMFVHAPKLVTVFHMTLYETGNASGLAQCFFH